VYFPAYVQYQVTLIFRFVNPSTGDTASDIGKALDLLQPSISGKAIDECQTAIETESRDSGLLELLFQAVCIIYKEG